MKKRYLVFSLVLLLSLTGCKKDTDDVEQTSETEQTIVTVDKKSNSLDDVTYQDIVITQEDSDETIVIEAPIDLNEKNVASELKEIKSTYDEIDLAGLIDQFAVTEDYYNLLSDNMETIINLSTRYTHIENHLSVEDRLDTYMNNQRVEVLFDIYQIFFNGITEEYSDDYYTRYNEYCEQYDSEHTGDEEASEDDWNPPQPTEEETIISFNDVETIQADCEEEIAGLADTQASLDDGSLEEMLIEVERLNKINEHNDVEGVE